MATAQNAQPRREGVDRLGAAASAACAAHCVLMALVPGLLAGLGLTGRLGHRLEWAFTIAAIAVGGCALIMGWRRHGSVAVAAVMAVGMLGLAAARVVEESGLEFGAMIGVASGLTLVAGHFANIRASRSCTAACR